MLFKRYRRQRKRCCKWILIFSLLICIVGINYSRRILRDDMQKQMALRLGRLNSYDETMDKDGIFIDTYFRRIKQFLAKRNVSISTYEQTTTTDIDLLIQMKQEIVNLQQIQHQELFNISHDEEIRKGCHESCCWSEKRMRHFYNGEKDRVPSVLDRLSQIDFKLLADLHYGTLPIPDRIILPKLTYDILPCLQKNTVIFVDTTDLKHFFRDFHTKISVNYILITGDSDFSCPSHIINTHFHLLDRIFAGKTHIVHWFSMNCNLGPNLTWKKSNIFTCIPQGISQSSNQRYYMHLASGKDDSIHNIHLKSNDYWIFTSFNKDNGNDREQLWDLSCNRRLRNISKCFYELNSIDQWRYYLHIARSKFVLSPPGDGIDCYRTWEALYLGSIPIVLNTAINSIFQQLPVLIIDDYEDITLELLKDVYDNMTRQSYEYKRSPVSKHDNDNTPNERIENSPHPERINRSVSIITKATPQEETLAIDDPSLVVDITPCQNFSLFFNLSLRSLGIIFGDIGTSPLYVVNTIFNDKPSETQCIGALSLIVWSLIVSVTIKYGIFILMADNHGEGGTFALCGLLTSEKSPLGVKTKRAITFLAIAAASLLLGDGALTPAVSVLSSVEGIAVEAPNLQNWILPISIIIIVLLFLAQRWGTSKIGVVFGPIMLLWFLSLFLIGIWRVTMRPRILRAFDPWEAFHYLLVEKKTGFYQIGGVFLSVTGLEALYADLGHFGRWPIRCAWLFVVFPAVLFNYLGQGALLIADPTLVDNPFYHAVPDWAHWPMVVLATVATIIASQAIITGSFSLISQAIGMQCSAPFKIFHTSRKVIGQIYVPTINFILMVLTVIVAAGFGTSSSITNAYGVTVCSVMIITTVLYMFVMHYIWRKPWYLILAFSIFLVTDGYTWASNAAKIPTGGWVAIVIAIGFFIFGFCWFFGELNLNRFLKNHSQTTSLHTLPIRLGLASNLTQHNSVNALGDLPLISTANRIEFEEDSDSDSDTVFEEKPKRKLPKVQSQVHLVQNVPASSLRIPIDFRSTDQAANDTIPAVITPGVGCFLTTSRKHTPHVFENFLYHMHSVPQLIIFLQIEHTKMATMKNDECLRIKQYGENIFHITAFYGYSEYLIQPHEILALARAEFNLPIPKDTKTVTMFVPNESIKVSTTGWQSWFRRWPLYLYSILKSIYPGVAVNIELKHKSTISIGILAKLD